MNIVNSVSGAFKLHQGIDCRSEAFGAFLGCCLGCLDCLGWWAWISWMVLGVFVVKGKGKWSCAQSADLDLE